MQCVHHIKRSRVFGKFGLNRPIHIASFNELFEASKHQWRNRSLCSKDERNYYGFGRNDM